MLNDFNLISLGGLSFSKYLTYLCENGKSIFEDDKI